MNTIYSSWKRTKTVLTALGPGTAWIFWYRYLNRHVTWFVTKYLLCQRTVVFCAVHLKSIFVTDTFLAIFCPFFSWLHKKRKKRRKKIIYKCKWKSFYVFLVDLFMDTVIPDYISLFIFLVFLDFIRNPQTEAN